jgi:NAD(P)-dependent dehydrogenase (short-subunit alcohol dehydrogenase family)
MARALSGAGARVAVTSRDRIRAEATAEELGAGALGLELDVRDPDSVSAAVDAAYGVLRGLDLLVNNAGIGMRTVNPRFMTDPLPLWDVSPAGFRDVLETKVVGTFLVARAVVPRMLIAGAGRVVTISMSEQTMVRRGFVPYGPSGAAVDALARVMAAADLAEREPVRDSAPRCTPWRSHAFACNDLPSGLVPRVASVLGSAAGWIHSRPRSAGGRRRCPHP